ncbi:hypothetical protein F5884DRAFT_838716 [Xylogone sp. PMI_703]|nr:hypothetical protein F5884DRAFT_838716 [Xylogone sp. PMI_703]
MDNGSTEWVDGLVEIALAMNTQAHTTINCVPAELLFRDQSSLELNLTIIVDNTTPPESAPESVTPHGEAFESTTPHGDTPGDIKTSVILTFPLKAKSRFESDIPFEKSQSDIDSDSSAEDMWYDTKSQLLITVDPLIQQAQIATQKVRVKMVQKYSKRHKIKHFKPGDIIAIRIPKEDRTLTDNRTLWGRILTEPYSYRYKIVTQYGVFNRLMSIKDLGVVNKHLWLSIVIPETTNEIILTIAAREASTSQRVKISC